MTTHRHPKDKDLALFAGGDASRWKQFRIRRHVKGCSRCASLMNGYHAQREELSSLANMPEWLDWDGLAAEMRGNISVGIEAARIVDVPAAPRERLGWQPAFVMAMLVMLVLGGWWYYFPHRGLQTRSDAPVILGATQQGIEMRQGDRALALMHSEAEDVSYSVDGGGSVRASYVDSETGNVTISHVYAE
jgi:hypothetical protein